MLSRRRRDYADARRLIFVCVACLVVAGCGSTPSFGPNVREVVDESRAAKRYGFVLVNVDAPVLQAVGAVPRGTLRDVFRDDRRVVPRLGPGDVLSISVYESGAGELFAPPTAQQLSYGTSNVTLPAVTVGPDGNITVPFASLIQVVGLTPLEVQDLIRRHLGGRSVQPQVLVSVTKDATNVVTVTGTVRSPGRYAITPASETLMQLIAEAGGATQQASDTVLQLTRNGRQVSVRLSDLLSFPQQDIHAVPGDYLNLVQEPRDFLVYGAVYKSGAYPLPADNVTLTEAISHAGGMVDTIADSRGVFVFRYGIR
jgi:polysaccharide export outer membrane protein